MLGCSRCHARVDSVIMPISSGPPQNATLISTVDAGWAASTVDLEPQPDINSAVAINPKAATRCLMLFLVLAYGNLGRCPHSLFDFDFRLSGGIKIKNNFVRFEPQFDFPLRFLGIGRSVDTPSQKPPLGITPPFCPPGGPDTSLFRLPGPPGAQYGRITNKGVYEN